MSRIDVLTESEIEASIAKSKLAKKYNKGFKSWKCLRIIKQKNCRSTKSQPNKKPKNQPEEKEEPSTAELVINYQSSYKLSRGAFGLLMKMFKR